MKLITVEQLEKLRAEFLVEHNQALAAMEAIDVLIQRLRPGCQQEADGAEPKPRQKRKWERRLKPTASNRDSSPAPRDSSPKRKHGWFRQAVREFVSTQTGNFTSRDVTAFLKERFPDLKQTQLYQVTAILLEMRETGELQREGTGSAAVYRITLAFNPDSASPSFNNPVSQDYRKFRESLDLKTPEVP